MERKTGFELKQLDEKGQFVARIARLNAIDKDLDVTLPGAFGNQQVAPVVIGHRWDMIPLGKVGITEEGDEVLARGRLNLGMGAGRALYEALRFDAANPPKTSQFSYAFSLEDFHHGTFGGQRVRFLKKLKVHEISAVLVGAGDTELVGVKQDALDQAALVASVQATLARGAALAERLAKLEGLISYRQVKMEGFLLQDPRRHLAREALFHAARELGVPPPALKFFTSTDPERADFRSEPMLGFADKSGIGVEWSLSPIELVRVVAHEVAHVADLGEAEAVVFGEKFAARYGTQFGTAPRRPSSLMTFDQVSVLAQAMRDRGMSATEIARRF